MMERKREVLKSNPFPAFRVNVAQEGINLAEDLNGEQCQYDCINDTFLEKSGKLPNSSVAKDWRFDVVTRARELSKQNTKLKMRLIKARSEASSLAEALVAANDRIVECTMESTRLRTHISDVQPNINVPLKAKGFREAHVKKFDFPQHSKALGLSVSSENLPQLTAAATATAERLSQQKKRTHHLSRGGEKFQEHFTGDENCPSLKRMASSVRECSWKMDDKKGRDVAALKALSELRGNQSSSSQAEMMNLKEEAKKLKEKLQDRNLALISAQKSETLALKKADQYSADASRISEILRAKEIELNALQRREDELHVGNRGLTQELETLRIELLTKQDVEKAMSNKLQMMETSLSTIQEELRRERKDKKRTIERGNVDRNVLRLKLNQAKEQATTLEDELEQTRAEMEIVASKSKQQRTARIRPLSCSVRGISRSNTTGNGEEEPLKDTNNIPPVLTLAIQSVAEKENREEEVVVTEQETENDPPLEVPSVLIPAGAASHSSNVKKDHVAIVNKRCKLSRSSLMDALRVEQSNVKDLKNEISRLNDAAAAHELDHLSELKTVQSNLDAEKARNETLCGEMTYGSSFDMDELKLALDKESAACAREPSTASLSSCLETLTLSLNGCEKKTDAHVKELMSLLLYAEALRSSLSTEKGNHIQALKRALDSEKEQRKELSEEISRLQSSTLEPASMLDMETLRSRLNEEKSRINELMSSLAAEKAEGEKFRAAAAAVEEMVSLSDMEKLQSSLDKEKAHTQDLVAALNAEKTRSEELTDKISKLQATAIEMIPLSDVEALKSSLHKEQCCVQELSKEYSAQCSAAEAMSKELAEMGKNLAEARTFIKTTGIGIISPTTMEIFPLVNKSFQPLPLYSSEYNTTYDTGNVVFDLPSLLNENRRLCKFGKQTVKHLQDATAVQAVAKSMKATDEVGFSASTEETETSDHRNSVVAAANAAPFEGYMSQPQQKQTAVLDLGKGQRNKALGTIMREVSSLRRANEGLKSIDLGRVMRIESLSEQLSNATKRLESESLRAKRAEETLAKAMMSGPSESYLSDPTKVENDGALYSKKIPPNCSVSISAEEAQCGDDPSSLVFSLQERCKQLERAMESSSNAERVAKAKSEAEIDLLRDDLQMKTECVLNLQREVKLLTESKDIQIAEIERRIVPRVPELDVGGDQLTMAPHCLQQQSHEDWISDQQQQHHIADLNDASKRDVERMSCKLLSLETKLAVVERRAKELGKKSNPNNEMDNDTTSSVDKAEKMVVCGATLAAAAVQISNGDSLKWKKMPHIGVLLQREIEAMSKADIELRNAELEKEKCELKCDLAEMAEKMERIRYETELAQTMEHKNQEEEEGGLMKQWTEMTNNNNDSKARETFLKEELSVRSAEVTQLQEKVINIKADASALNDCLKEEITSLENELSLALNDSKQARELQAQTAGRLNDALSSKSELDASISLINKSISSKLEEHKATLEQKAIALDEEREAVGVHLRNSLIALRALLEKKGQAVCHLRCETFISEAETASTKAKWEKSNFLIMDELACKSEKTERLQMALDVARLEAASCCEDTEREVMDLKETQAFMEFEKKELALSVELLEYTLKEQSELIQVIQEDSCRAESDLKLNQMMQENEIELLRNAFTEKEVKIKTALQKVSTSEMHAGHERSKLELSIALLKHEMEERTIELQRIQSGFSNTLSIAESTNNELEQENASLKNELDLMKDELDHNVAFLSAKLTLKMNEVKQLEQELDLKNDEFDNDRSFLKGELLSKSEEVKQLEERLEDVQADATSGQNVMKMQLNEKEKLLIEALREKEELVIEVASLNNALVTERSKVKSEAAERCLRSEIASLKRLLSEERENDRNDRTRLENELAKHKEELEALSIDHNNIRITKSEQELEIVSLKNVVGNKTSELEKVKLGIVAREDESVFARQVLEDEIVLLEDKLDSQKDEVDRMRRTIVFSKTEAGLSQKELEMKVSFLENSLRLCLEKLERKQQHHHRRGPPSRLSFHCAAAVAGGGGGSSASFDLKTNGEKENEVEFLCHPLRTNDADAAMTTTGFKCRNNNAENVPPPPLEDVATTKLVDNTTQINAATLKNKIVNTTVVRSKEEVMVGRPGINRRTMMTETLGVNIATAGTAAALKERRAQNDDTTGNSGSGLVDDGIIFEEGCRTYMNDSNMSGFSFGLSSSTEEYSEIKNVEESALELPLPFPVTTTTTSTTMPADSSSRRRLSAHRGPDEQPKEETHSTNRMNGGSNESAELMSCSGTPLDSSELRLFEPEFLLEYSMQHDEPQPELLGGEDSIISSLFSNEKSGGGKLKGGQPCRKGRAVHLSTTMSPPHSVSSSSSHRRSSRPWRKKLRSAFRFWGLFSTKSSMNSEGLSLYHSSSSYSGNSGSTTTDYESCCSGYDYSQSSSEGEESINRSKHSDGIRKNSQRNHEEEKFKILNSKCVTRVTPQLRRKEEKIRSSPPTDHSVKSKIGQIDGSSSSPPSYVWVDVDIVATGLSPITALHEPRPPKRRKSGIALDEQDADTIVSAEIVQSHDPLRPSMCTMEAGDQSSAIIDMESARPGWGAVLKQLRQIKLPDPVYYPYWELGF